MQSYPPPTRAGTNEDNPFYGSLQSQLGLDTVPEEVPDDPQLRADLARSLRVVAALSGSQQPQLLDFNGPSIAPKPLQSRSSESPTLDAQDAAAITHESQGAFPAETRTARKDFRQKTSKACDECRKKKIRCDTTDDVNAGICSHCKRSGTKCDFTRQQMKRGPTKGYMKNISERLNSLEHRIHSPTQQDPASDLPVEPHTSNLDFTVTRSEHQDPNAQLQQAQTSGYKRTYTGQPVSNTAALLSTADFYDDAFDTAGINLNTHDLTQGTSYLSSVEVPPIPQAYFRPSPGFGSLQSVSIPYDGSFAEPPPIPGWHDNIVDAYYRLIHRTLPILPHSRIALKSRLLNCPANLRQAFLTSLTCYLQTFPRSNFRPSQDYAINLKHAADLLATYPFEAASTHTTCTDLVHLQTLILMALESDNHGPATVKGQVGPSRAEWLSRAAAAAGQSGINLVRPTDRLGSEDDPDSDRCISRRVWWSLFILDRWHASSVAGSLKLPENCGTLLPEDQIVLGESTYHLARLSFIVGHLSEILSTIRDPSTDVLSPTNPASKLLLRTLTGEIDRFRESVESVWGSLNLVHLSYHHLHLLMKRLTSSTEPTELIGHALKVATVLNQRQTPITPLNHHFAALSAMTLADLADLPETAHDAKRGLLQLADALGMGRGLAGHPSESTGWDSAIRTLVAKKLMKLDEAAANGTFSIQSPTAFDPTLLTKYGYLTALAQDRLL